MSERRKFTLHMHPDDAADQLALDVIESISQRVRGDFLRNAVITGCALHLIDKRLPALMSALFDGQPTADQFIKLIQQTTGWKPGDAEIRQVIESLSGGEGSQAVRLNDNVINPDRELTRSNMNAMFPSKNKGRDER